MSRTSPDGNYVITSIDVPGAHSRRITDRLYNGSFTFYGFGQVFFPTRGVLAWYSRRDRMLKPLPGADDPGVRSHQRVLEPRRQVPGFFSSQSQRSFCARPTTRQVRQ